MDLESYEDRARLIDPILFFNQYNDHLVILDEIHQMPEIFKTLRGVIDKNRRNGKKNKQFLILGSASIDLLKQSGESLAGRIAYIDMGAINLLEVPEADLTKLWVRGGLPESYTSISDEDSFAVRRDFIRSYISREIGQFVPKYTSDLLERFWIMLAHLQGTMLNISKLSKNLSIPVRDVNHYINVMVDLLILRRLMPYHTDIGKRLVKTPKLYIKDSGIVHALLSIKDYNNLSPHPVIGNSWEGFVIENIMSVVPVGTMARFYRTSAGAEIDLVLEMNMQIWAIEIKNSLAPKPSRGFYEAIKDIKADKSFIIYQGKDEYPIADDIQVISLAKIMKRIDELS